ncbi:hypothetical protein E1B28_001757 [Marasmius oreades]|uniref:Uncharacterized protein n=1 Tax=Marasmius oreades TaxID=181124 RepID=A0A9P7V495_9AGAR|nr:uncharacterized protein E1B28_001757 [Marasmius oreades]KAG7099964.1 hypothetical protein E1B28_001757 [Marasmius oreades]
MKLPSSSSLIFATLAISSSSSSLAAPTGDGQPSSGIPASTSFKPLRRDSVSMPQRITRDVEDGELEPREASPACVIFPLADGILNRVGGIVAGIPLIGTLGEPVLKLGEAVIPLASHLLKCPEEFKSPMNSASVQTFDTSQSGAANGDSSSRPSDGTPPNSPTTSSGSASASTLARRDLQPADSARLPVQPPVKPPVGADPTLELPGHLPVPIDSSFPPVQPPVKPLVGSAPILELPGHPPVPIDPPLPALVNLPVRSISGTSQSDPPVSQRLPGTPKQFAGKARSAGPAPTKPLD